MFEIMDDSLENSTNDKRRKDKHSHGAVVLPKIDRGQARAVTQIRSTSKIPASNSDEPNVEDAMTQRKIVSEKNIMHEVDKQIKFVMEREHIMELEASLEGSSDQEQDFQKKIQENKKIIKEVKKQHEEKKENQKVERRKRREKVNKKEHRTGRKKYQERMKAVRDGSIETIDHIKHKQSLPLHQQAKEVRFAEPSKQNLLREVRSNEELQRGNKIIGSAKVIPESSKAPSRQMSQKQLAPIERSQKNEPLFEIIHNYLDNPSQKHPLAGGSAKKDRATLEAKLKQYQKKLQREGSGLNLSQGCESPGLKPVDSAKEWMKIGIKEGHLQGESSSFDQQLNRINLYLSNNQHSIDKYVQNHQLLMDMQLAAKRHSIKDTSQPNKMSA